MEKVKCEKASIESEKFFGNRGKSETGGKCIIASGGWTPLRVYMYFPAVEKARLWRKCAASPVTGLIFFVAWRLRTSEHAKH